jgi:hypothetical protein
MTKKHKVVDVVDGKVSYEVVKDFINKDDNNVYRAGSRVMLEFERAKQLIDLGFVKVKPFVEIDENEIFTE